MRSHLRYLALALVAAVLVTGLATAADDEPASEPKPSDEALRRTTVAAAAGSDAAARSPAADSLAILRRPQRPADLPPDVIAGTPLASDGSADVASARRAQPGEGHPAWIMPGGNRSICYASYGTLNCAPAEILTSRGLVPVLSKRSGEPIRVEGIAGDGVRNIEARFESGEKAGASASDNAFVIESDRAPVRLEWDAPGGHHSFTLPSLAPPPVAE